MISLPRRAALSVLAFACLAIAGCDNPDKLVKITYQQLGNGQSWAIGGGAGGSTNGDTMWHVYMLRGVVNTGAKAEPFTFDPEKIALKDGTVLGDIGPMAQSNPRLLPTGLKPKVQPNSAYTVPYSQGVLFIIKEDNDTDKTAITPLIYKSASGESVLMAPLDPKAAPVFGVINEAFLEQLHVKQNAYENDYAPDGVKH